MKPADLSVETQRKICASHVEHFNKLIELGRSDKPAARTVRVLECEAYLGTWVAGDAALAAGLPLPADTADEMQDAINSGDAEEFMTVEELTQAREEDEEAVEELTKLPPEPL